MLQTDINLLENENVFLFGWKEKKDARYTLEIVQGEKRANKRKSYFLDQDTFNWFVKIVSLPSIGEIDTTEKKETIIDLEKINGFIPVKTEVKF